MYFRSFCGSSFLLISLTGGHAFQACDIIMVKINGELMDMSGKTVAEAVESLGISSDRIAVELNLEIVPKAKYSETLLSDGDTVEVVRFVGGG